MKKVQDVVLSKWQNDIYRIDKRPLALLYMAHASDVLENAFAPLSDDEYELAMKRVRDLLDVDPDEEATKPNANHRLHTFRRLLFQHPYLQPLHGQFP